MEDASVLCLLLDGYPQSKHPTRLLQTARLDGYFEVVNKVRKHARNTAIDLLPIPPNLMPTNLRNISNRNKRLFLPSLHLMHGAMQVEGALRELSRKQAELESREKQLDEAHGTSSAGALALVTDAATAGGASSAGEHEGTEWKFAGSLVDHFLSTSRRTA